MTTTTFFVMAAIVIILIGLSKGGLGGTLAALATPLMAVVMPAHKVIGLLLPILIIADVFALAAHWMRWDKKLVALLLPGAILGVAIGTFFLTSISPEALRRVIGIIILFFVVYKMFETRIQNSVHYSARNWHGVVVGSALVETVASAGPDRESAIAAAEQLLASLRKGIDNPAS